MSEQQRGFAFESAALTEAVRVKIDELVAKLKQEPGNLFITSQEHTDFIGPASVNERLGLEGARSVAEYV